MYQNITLGYPIVISRSTDKSYANISYFTDLYTKSYIIRSMS